MSPLIKPLANLEGRLYVYSQTVIDVPACTFCIGLRQRISLRSPEIAPEPTAVPRNLTVIDVASESVTLRWEPIETAEAYYLYYASEPFEDVNNIHAYRDGEWQADVSSPYKITGLTNNTTYYFLVTAMIDGAESPPGFSVNATPVDTLSGPQPSAEEVRVIELINRARRDPEQEVEVMSRNVKLDVLVVGDEVRIDYW